MGNDIGTINSGAQGRCAFPGELIKIRNSQKEGILIRWEECLDMWEVFSEGKILYLFRHEIIFEKDYSKLVVKNPVQFVRKYKLNKMKKIF